MRALREELVCPGMTDVDDADLINWPFSDREFSAALSFCNARSALGLDGVGFGVFLSERARGFLLSLFNLMLSVFSFPLSWGDTLMNFVAKASSDKFRPILLTSTLCKIFERLIQKRLKFLAENKSWIPSNQFGFSEEMVVSPSIV